MKAAKRMSGLLLASAVGITTAFSGVTYFAPVTEVYAANSVTVTTQAELNKALSDSSVTAVTIRSDAKKLKIKKGNYNAIDLSVIASNTKVVNAGSFNSVTIRNAKAFVEKASGNYIRTIDGSVKIALKKAAKKTSIRIDKEKCVTAINVAGSLEKLDITKSDCKTTLNVTGSVDEIIERAASDTVVNGSSKDSIETTISGEGAVFKTGVPASVEVSAKADITFEKGAESSSVKATGNGSTAKVTNNSDSSISVSDGTASGTVASGTSAAVSEGAKNTDGGSSGSSDGGSSGSTDTTATGAIKSVTQVTFDEAVLSFASAVDSSTVSTATVGINGSVGAATSVTVAEDGLSASVVYAYAEDTAYTFAVNGLDGTAGFTTGSYAVTDIYMEDQTVAAGSDQELSYKLLAGKVDVTRYGSYLDYVSFDFDGDQTTYSSDPAKLTVYFDEKGKKTTVTAKFDDGKTKATKTAKITSSAATATKGTAYFADDLLKWYLVKTNKDNFDITPETSDKRIVFFVRGGDKKAVKMDDIEVSSSNENVAEVSWDQQAEGKYYILRVNAGGNAGTAKITVKTTEYRGSEEVHGEYNFSITSKEFNNNLYSVETDSSSIQLYNTPYSPTYEASLKPLNSIGEIVDADVDIEVYKGSDSTDEVTATYKNNKLIINALGATGGTYKVEAVVTGEAGNSTKELKKTYTVRVTDAISAVYPDGWSVSNGTIMTAGGVADEISATYKVEAEDLYINDYNGNKLSTNVKLAVYMSSKPIGYISASGVEGFDKGWEIGAKVLYKTGAFSGSYDKVDFSQLGVYVYNGSNYYCNVKNDILYLGQLQKNEYTTKANAKSDSTIKVGDTVTLLSCDGSTVNEIYYYGDGSTKNNTAAAGTYNLMVKYGSSFDDGKQIGSAGKLKVSYSLTMPEVTYNTSESADHYAVADVDLVRAEDGYSVSYCAGRDTIKFPNYTFGNGSLSSGDKISAVMVNDVRGGKLGDAAENYDPGYLADTPGAAALRDKLSFEGGVYEEGVLIHFIIEKTVKITA